jgi:hypothetical protein
VDEHIRGFVALGELDREYRWFRPMMVAIASELLSGVAWGVKVSAKRARKRRCGNASSSERNRGAAATRSVRAKLARKRRCGNASSSERNEVLQLPGACERSEHERGAAVARRRESALEVLQLIRSVRASCCGHVSSSERKTVPQAPNPRRAGSRVHRSVGLVRRLAVGRLRRENLPRRGGGGRRCCLSGDGRRKPSLPGLGRDAPDEAHEEGQVADDHDGVPFGGHIHKAG